MKLLHIDASALGQHSVSRGLTAAIVTELKRQHAGLEISYGSYIPSIREETFSLGTSADGSLSMCGTLAQDVVQC